MGIVKQSKVGARGQIVIPKILREGLGFEEGSDILIKVVDEEIHIRSAKKNIISKWSKIAKSEGGNVRKEIIYGDRLYETIF